MDNILPNERAISINHKVIPGSDFLFIKQKKKIKQIYIKSRANVNKEVQDTSSRVMRY